MRRFWNLLKDAGEGFVADDALTHAAGIAYFTLFSIGPLLFIVTGIAGLIVGREMVDEAIAAQIAGMMGDDAAREISRIADHALGEARGPMALLIGGVTLLLTAGGAFGALQTALNAVWKAQFPPADSMGETVSRFVRAKGAALGLVATTGFLLIVSMAVSAAITAFSGWLEQALPGGKWLAMGLSLAVNLTVLSALFAAIYKILPDRTLEWRDVLVGAVATAVLFTAGKSLIAMYVGSSSIAAGFGAAGTIIVVLVWIYYSALIFLAGAEFTRAWANREGSRQANPIPAQNAGAVIPEEPPAPPSDQLPAWMTLSLVAGFSLLVFRRILHPRQVAR